jgi:hypothetical protein
MADAPDDDGQLPSMEVTLMVDKASQGGQGRRLISDRLKIKNSAPRDFKLSGVSKGAVRIQLNTMLEAGLGDSPYWLDSGSVVLK